MMMELEQCLFLSIGCFYNDTQRSKRHTHFLGLTFYFAYFEVSRNSPNLALNTEKSFRKNCDYQIAKSIDP